MYMHQALPKDIYVPNRHRYQIKNKKSSPNTKLHSPRGVQNPTDSSIVKYSSSQKTHLHHIASKEKPYLHSFQQSPSKPAILSKNSSIISAKSKKRPIKQDQKRQESVEKEQNMHKFPENEVVICKMQNKVIKNVEISFQFSDLSLIQSRFIKSYDGQCKNNGIRHGFGIQHYSNGQKFVGFFHQNMACGQGTYYTLDRKIMGIWQKDKLKQIILQL